MNKNAREKLLLETAYLSIYNPRLLAEKAVDGTLMCSKDCCGSPVMECKCGDDCPHCNCFMIQKAVKDYGLKSPLLESNDNDTIVVTRNYPADDPHSTHNTRISKKDLEKFKKMGYKNKSEDEEQPRDSMYLKDDPEALNKALAWHRNNVAKLRRKSMLDLTDEEYDSLKHSEGELELNEGEEDYVRLTKGSTFNVTNVNVPKEDKELIDHYMKKGFKEVKKPSEDNELEALIAAEDAEDINKDEEKDVDVKEGGGTSADEFKEEEKTGYA